MILLRIPDLMLTTGLSGDRFSDGRNLWALAEYWGLTARYLKQEYNIDFTVPLGMDMVAGTHWNEGTATIYDDVRNGRAA